MHNEIWRLSACEVAKGIRNRRFSCVQVMESVISRVRERNTYLNAIVNDLTIEALAEAQRADEALARGAKIGPLHGVPITIKQNIDLKGQPTPNGLPGQRNVIAQEDSPVVRNMRKAGAIIIGQTNIPELSMRATTDNPLHGRTINPWDEQASPGGSSGGSAVAAAAGFGPIHHGNDIGGSLRFPSFACGVAGLKPTFGRIPAYTPSAGEEPGILSQLVSVQGAICREVRDLRLATNAMMVDDPRDPWWVPVPFKGPPESKPIKVAFTKETCGYPIHPEIISLLDRAAECLSNAGYAVEEVSTPSIREPAQGWFDVMVSEIEETLGPLARQYGSETIQRIFGYINRIGDVVDCNGFRNGIAERTTLTRDWNVFLADYPLVLTPFLMRPTYPWDYDARGFDETRDIFMAAIYSIAINYLSLPAGVVPVGFADNLPAAVQIVGRRFREDLILDAMETIESETGILSHKLWARECSGRPHEVGRTP